MQLNFFAKRRKQTEGQLQEGSPDPDSCDDADSLSEETEEECLVHKRREHSHPASPVSRTASRGKLSSGPSLQQWFTARKARYGGIMPCASAYYSTASTTAPPCARLQDVH